jgi:IS30 family transposase
MKKLKHGKDADELAQEVIRLLAPYKGLIKTITTDNGTEF